MLNRCGVIATPKQPYIDWAISLDDSGLTPSAAPSTIYLIPTCDDEETAWQLLKHGYDSIFDAELEAWHRLESDWPKERTFAMFRDWFDIQILPLIEDLCDGPIQDDEFDD